MTLALRCSVLLACCVLFGCTQTPVTQPLRSLEKSGEVSFFCADVTDLHPKGVDIESCPDLLENKRHMFALVTQTFHGEVAVIDLNAGDRGQILDVNPSVPGYNFLPVGEQPVDIVSTPGGAASFVAVAEPGRAGIFAIPTGCVKAPNPGEHVRDLTSWPACALPVPPRDLSIILEPEEKDGNCGSAANEPAVNDGRECPADVNGEEGPKGRRKLVVTLPEHGTIGVVDAQWLLNQDPGSFNNCKLFEYPLSSEVGSALVSQIVPNDLALDPTCTLPETNNLPVQDPSRSYPVKQALGGNTLYIADSHRPLIHRLDVTDLCDAHLEDPLLPLSLEEPGSVVTTRDLAVSPPTTSGNRYLYAVEGDERGAVMMFDVSPGATDRTPLVRPGSQRMPYEPPDRLLFSAPARAVAFGQNDAPKLDDLGTAYFGVPCSPDPNDTSVGSQYRTAADYTTGAGPRNLRGTFGFVVLSNGQIAVIDVEDLDAQCRRPRFTNSTATPDFRGCVNDPPQIPFFTSDQSPSGTPTVSDEVSCGVVRQHRARGASYVIDNNVVGVRAPSLRALPRLSSIDGLLVSDNSADGRKNPKLLAVDFDPLPIPQRQPAQVFVGSTLYGAVPNPQDAAKQFTPPNAEQTLDLNPATAERNSLVLPLIEPRSYSASEDFAVTYEGVVTGDYDAGLFGEPTESTIVLQQNVTYCQAGIEAADVLPDGSLDPLSPMAAQATRLHVAPQNASAFARKHADYVQLLTPIPGPDEDVWKSEFGRTCGEESAQNVPGGYDTCLREFGAHDAKQLAGARDLRILEAYQDHLLLEFRDDLDEAARTRRLAMLKCCFPSYQTYRVRAGSQWVVRGSSSGFRHDVRADPSTFRCIHDCNPLLRYFRSRAFEISSTGWTADACIPANQDTHQGCIGPAQTADSLPAQVKDYACIVGSATAAVEPGKEGSECIFENLTARFAIYRANADPAAEAQQHTASELRTARRDYSFTWSTVGGFSTLAASIVDQTTSVSPRSMVFVPELGELAIVDGRLAGLTFVKLKTIGVSRLFY